MSRFREGDIVVRDRLGAGTAERAVVVAVDGPWLWVRREGGREPETWTVTTVCGFCGNTLTIALDGDGPATAP